jgi:hypothetical protein
MKIKYINVVFIWLVELANQSFLLLINAQVNAFKVMLGDSLNFESIVSSIMPKHGF